jgi:hypothetical protein
MQKHEKSTVATVYREGSSIEGKIGAVIFEATINETRYRHLGKDTDYNVFMAELAALHLAIETLRDKDKRTEWVAHIQTISRP